MTEKRCATREATNLPNNKQFHPDSHKSRQRAKGLQDIRVVTTRFLNACSQLSIAEGTCESETEASQETSRNNFPSICKVNNRAAMVTQQLLVHSNPPYSFFKRLRSSMSFRWTCVSHGTKCLQARCFLLIHTGVAQSAASCQQCKALWHIVVSKYCPAPSNLPHPWRKAWIWHSPPSSATGRASNWLMFGSRNHRWRIFLTGTTEVLHTKLREWLSSMSIGFLSKEQLPEEMLKAAVSMMLTSQSCNSTLWPCVIAGPHSALQPVDSSFHGQRGHWVCSMQAALFGGATRKPVCKHCITQSITQISNICKAFSLPAFMLLHVKVKTTVFKTARHQAQRSRKTLQHITSSFCFVWGFAKTWQLLSNHL